MLKFIVKEFLEESADPFQLSLRYEGYTDSNDDDDDDGDDGDEDDDGGHTL